MTKRRMSIWLRLPLIVVALLTVWVWQRVTVVKMIRANDLLRAEVQLKNEMKDKSSTEVSRLLQRTRIEKIATGTLGLAPTRPGQQRVFSPWDLRDNQIDMNGWERLNNSLRRLSVASVTNVLKGGNAP